MNVFVTIILTIIFTVIGQLLTKKGMSLAPPMPSNNHGIVLYLVKTMFLNPYVLSGLIMAVLAAMSWMATLSKANLSFAYPFMSLAFPLVLVCSAIFFGENISMQRWLGLAIIIIGLIVVAKS